jgi:tetratricopeptide (TPR) repeat protein
MRCPNHPLRETGLGLLGLMPALVYLSTSVVVASEPARLARELAAIEEAHAGLCPAAADAPEFQEALSALAGQFRRTNGADRPGIEAFKALNHFLFNDIGVRGSPDLKDPCNLLPGRVFQRKLGYCVGIAALYLALADEIGLPVHAVAALSHVFLRYDDGTTRVNIETFQQGATIPDERYAREHRIPEKSIRKGIFLRNLTPREFLAQVHNNLGVIYSERRRFEEAERQYEEAVRLDPRLPAAWYNYGNDLLLRGEHRGAARMFSRALRLYPTDVWALNNRGLARLKMGKHRKARRDLEEALQLDPGFEPARRNLEQISPTR